MSSAPKQLRGKGFKKKYVGGGRKEAGLEPTALFVDCLHKEPAPRQDTQGLLCGASAKFPWEVFHSLLPFLLCSSPQRMALWMASAPSLAAGTRCSPRTPRRRSPSPPTSTARSPSPRMRRWVPPQRETGVEKGLQALGAGVGYVGSVPQGGLQARPGVNDSSQVIWLRSCQRAEKSLGYKPEGGEVGSLFPYQGKGAHKNGALSPSWSTGVTFQLHLPAGLCPG